MMKYMSTLAKLGYEPQNVKGDVADFDEDDEAKLQQRWKPLKQRDIMMMVTMMMSKQIMVMMRS